MNTKSINSAIAIMTRHMEAQLPLYMSEWQTGGLVNLVKTEEHLCGTPCCFAGYIAVSPEFQKDGGWCSAGGAPAFEGGRGANAIREWFECNTNQASNLCSPGCCNTAYPLIEFAEREPLFSEVIAALVSLRDTSKLPGEIVQ